MFCIQKNCKLMNYILHLYVKILAIKKFNTRIDSIKGISIRKRQELLKSDFTLNDCIQPRTRLLNLSVRLNDFPSLT